MGRAYGRACQPSTAGALERPSELGRRMSDFPRRPSEALYTSRAGAASTSVHADVPHGSPNVPVSCEKTNGRQTRAAEEVRTSAYSHAVS
jgi:hypothetical protein